MKIFTAILLTSITLTSACQKPDWVEVPIAHPITQDHMWYEPSSIRKIGSEEAIVNVLWVGPDGRANEKTLMRFGCSQRTYRISNIWHDFDGTGRKLSSLGESPARNVMPNEGIEVIFDAACD